MIVIHAVEGVRASLTPTTYVVVFRETLIRTHVCFLLNSSKMSDYFLGVDILWEGIVRCKGEMKIYELSQDKNTGYETHDCCVVVAENEEDARRMHPFGDSFNLNNTEWWKDASKYDTWAHPTHVKAILLGTARLDLEAGVVLASFNAG